jgi:hypothetical protein
LFKDIQNLRPLKEGEVHPLNKQIAHGPNLSYITYASSKQSTLILEVVNVNNNPLKSSDNWKPNFHPNASMDILLTI